MKQDLVKEKSQSSASRRETSLREITQLLEGAKYYLDLAEAEEILPGHKNTPNGELGKLEASRSSKYPLFRKGAHLNSAAIRICTAYEIIKPKNTVQQHRINHVFYLHGGKYRKNEMSVSDIKQKIFNNLSQFVAYLLRDTITHPELDRKSDNQYFKDKEYYLSCLSPAQEEAALRQAYEKLIKEWKS